MESVRIGMVGSGFMAHTYSEVVARYAKGGRLVAIAGGSRAPALAGRYGVARRTVPRATPRPRRRRRRRPRRSRDAPAGAGAPRRRGGQACPGREADGDQRRPSATR